MVGVYIKDSCNMKRFLDVIKDYDLEFCIVANRPDNTNEYDSVVTDDLSYIGPKILAVGRELETIDDILFRFKLNKIENYKLDSYNSNLTNLKEAFSNYVKNIEKSENDIDYILSDYSCYDIVESESAKHSNVSLRFKNIKTVTKSELPNDITNYKSVMRNSIIENIKLNENDMDSNCSLNVIQALFNKENEMLAPEIEETIVPEIQEEVFTFNDSDNVSQLLDVSENKTIESINVVKDLEISTQHTGVFDDNMLDSTVIEMLSETESSTGCYVKNELSLTENPFGSLSLYNIDLNNPSLVISDGKISKIDTAGNIDCTFDEYANIIQGRNRDADREVLELASEPDDISVPELSEDNSFIDETLCIESVTDTSIVDKNYNKPDENEYDESRNFTREEFCRKVLQKFCYKIVNTNNSPKKFSWLLSEFKDWNYTKVISNVTPVRGFKSRRSSVSKNHIVISLGAGSGGTTFAVNLASVLMKERLAEQELNKNSILRGNKKPCILVDMDFNEASLSNNYGLLSNIDGNLLSIFTNSTIDVDKGNSILSHSSVITQSNVPVVPVTPMYTITEKNKKVILENNWNSVMTAINEMYLTAVYDYGSVPEINGLSENEYKKDLQDFTKLLCDMRTDSYIYLCFNMSSNIEFKKSLDLLYKLRDTLDNYYNIQLNAVVVPIMADMFSTANLETRLNRNEFKILKPLQKIESLSNGFVGYDESIEEYCKSII